MCSEPCDEARSARQLIESILGEGAAGRFTDEDCESIVAGLTQHLVANLEEADDL